MILEIFTGVFTLLFSIGSFYIKRLYNDMDALKKELTEHRLEDVEKFLPRSEMHEYAERIRNDVQGIINPVNSKLQSIEEFLRNRRREDH